MFQASLDNHNYHQIPYSIVEAAIRSAKYPSAVRRGLMNGVVVIGGVFDRRVPWTR